MVPSIAQTFGQQFLLNHSELFFLICFAILFVFFNIFGILIHGRLLGAFFGTIVTVMNLVLGFIPFWVALIGFAICVIEVASYSFKKQPQEKPAETPRKIFGITGEFDKSQFNKKN